MHKKFTIFTLAAGLLFWAIYAFLPTLPIPGIEIGMVYSLGIIAVLILLFIMTYSLRKRVARGIPGRLDKWLWAHIYLGILALFIVALHAEFRFVDVEEVFPLLANNWKRLDLCKVHAVGAKHYQDLR